MGEREHGADNGRSKSWDTLPDGMKEHSNLQIGGAPTSNDWAIEMLMPTLFVCWAFLNAIFWITGMVEFEQAAIFILFSVVLLQFLAIVRSGGE